MGASSRTWPLAVVLLAVAALAGGWYKLVDGIVPDPYLVSTRNR